MISAETLALRHDAVTRIVEIRHKEIDFMQSRMEAIGTQSAFLGAMMVGNLCSIPIPDNLLLLQHVYLYSTALGLVGSMHCILGTTYASLWGPGLALNGPKGSVSRAYIALKAEQTHIRGRHAGRGRQLSPS